ncbi:MAG TPA: transcriptional repressor [Clostridiales bacterium]|nr:transcriptional repressor [Clostridiales bacterium]
MKETPSGWPAGLKKTKQRQCVLSVLEQAEKPLSAMEIASLIGKEDCTIWLSTVYRVLELFVKENVAVKTVLSDSEKAFYELNRNEHKHYAVCLNCHKVVKIDSCPLKDLAPQQIDEDFQITGHKLEMYGYCKDCKEKDGAAKEK